MTNEEIQKHIEQNCRYGDGSPAMDEQAFYEGAKWMRDKALSLHNVSQQRELFVSFARFAHNYGKGSYGTSYEEMFSEWLGKRNK